MDKIKLRELKEFYKNELCGNILPFWLERCPDERHGGYFNCYDNYGRNLVSRDKYTWSQGRFVWMWSKLATSECGVFTDVQRGRFLEMAKSGRNFLYEHCLLGKNDFRCVYLMDETGSAKLVEGYGRLDMSIYADFFVIAAFARYALAASDEESYLFAKNLYISAAERVKTGNFTILPYTLSGRYRSLGIPMIFSNVTSEMYYSASEFDPNYLSALKANLQNYASDILDNFADENNVLHELITADNRFFPRMLGQHANPGHSLETMWFLDEAAEILNCGEWAGQLEAIVKKTLEIGWDHDYGGLLHMCSVRGGMPQGAAEGDEDEPMLRQAIDCWSDKLWWVHSEALYATLLFYCKTGDPALLAWHNRITGYTFGKFPNPDRDIGEWIQILTREALPQEKIVALPVKDPYHITRDLILIVELLHKV